MAKIRRYAAMPLALLSSTVFSCAITSPTPGATVTQGTPVTITGTTTAGAVTVQVKLGATVLGSASIVGLDWSYSWTPQVGDVGAGVLSAVATAPSGSQAAASNVAITVASSAFGGDFTSLFTGTKLAVIQGDRGIAQSGGIITGVTDQAASIAFASNSSGQRPLVGTGYNGHASITFDGADDELAGTVALLNPSTNPYYVYAVFKPTTKGGQANYFGGSTGGGTLYSSSGNVNSLIQTSGGTGNTSSMTNALTRVYAEFTGTTADRLKSGANAFVTGTSAGTLASSTLVIGALVAGGFAANMDLVLLAYSTGVLSSLVMSDIDTKAVSYWGSVAV